MPSQYDNAVAAKLTIIEAYSKETHPSVQSSYLSLLSSIDFKINEMSGMLRPVYPVHPTIQMNVISVPMYASGSVQGQIKVDTKHIGIKAS